MSATSPTDPALLSAAELVALYRAKQLSPVEAVRATLARIERFNPIVNAYCHLDSAGGLALPLRLEADAGCAAEDRLAGGGAPQGAGRHHPRQDRHAGIRLEGHER